MKRRSVGTSNRGNMRHGLISLLTVIVVLALATAAVLTVATSHAMAALSGRQASMTSEGYAAETAGQTFLAELDDELLALRTSGTKGTALMDALENRVNGMLAKACGNDVSATYSVDDMTLTCEFTTTSGRMLQVEVLIRNNATYEIASWKLMAMPQEEDTGDTLWTGPTAKE